MYKFIWSGLIPNTDATGFNMRTSSDNGSTWDAGASDYAFIKHRTSMAVAPAHEVVGDDLATVAGMAGLLGNDTNESSSWEITLFNPSGTGFTKFKFEGFREDNAGIHWHDCGATIRLQAAAVNGVRFLHGAGTIFKGTLKVYGCRA